VDDAMCKGNCQLLGLPCECPRPGRPPTRPCGTKAAYRRHQRHGETPCTECRQAASRWHADYRRAQRKAAALRKADDADPLTLAFRELLDLISAECRRAGYLP